MSNSMLLRDVLTFGKELLVGLFEDAQYFTIGDVKNSDIHHVLQNLFMIIEQKKKNNKSNVNWKRVAIKVFRVIYNIQHPENADHMQYIPDAFCCPLLFNWLNDPVIAPSGYTYEKSAILLWISVCNKDPYTGNLLTSDMLIPNLGLKQAIEIYAPLEHQYLIRH